MYYSFKIKVRTPDEKLLKQIRELVKNHDHASISVKKEKMYPVAEAPAIKEIQAYPFTPEQKEQIRREVLAECGLLKENV
ncbi:hypothetical protein DCO58_00925 [Helicobacter saguini]|uniref:Uncharacterized protein n=1 Tax=Helicobacter saguini TaxID=1548018 RepID=A0A347VR36_9HELI|nr:hypothetical protein [Helicobacter saguini]MWV63048.1 hypothetical protein [Helicobacter saguini]MWV66283.1 hypothetical protein [Helicobacter saguini]MWV68635.1 hypothetical protein [Helicobacter saguini]MWV71814.1 hypothetical protein [Helicobacter saguini]TLD95840.1 hypothetical protein LS64_000260 [Helicobacter saguini]